MTELTLTEARGAVRFAVHVKPRSSRSRIEGVRDDGALIVALKAPPVDGAANEELIKLISRQLGVSKTSVAIASGATGRRKVIDVSGLDRAQVAASLPGARSPEPGA